MKKISKLIIALSLLILTVFSLCSCKALDEMKAMHAVYDENKNIVWNNSSYMKLPQEYSEMIAEEKFTEILAVTEPDVPVLLAVPLDIFNSFTYYDEDNYDYNFSYFKASEDGKMIMAYISGYWGSDIDIYCCEDIYNEMLEKYKEPAFDSYIIKRLGFHNFETFEWEYETYKLTDDEKTQIDEILNSTDLIKADDSISDEFDTEIEIGIYTDDMFMKMPEEIIIKKADGKYYIDKTENEEYFIYEIPEKYYQLLDKLVEWQEYISDEAKEYFEQYYGDYFGDDFFGEPSYSSSGIIF